MSIGPPGNGEAGAVGNHPTNRRPGNRSETTTENNRSSTISAGFDPSKEKYYDELFCQSLELMDRRVHAFLERSIGRALWVIMEYPWLFPAFVKREVREIFWWLRRRRDLYQTEIARVRCDCDVLALSHNNKKAGGER